MFLPSIVLSFKRCVDYLLWILLLLTISHSDSQRLLTPRKQKQNIRLFICKYKQYDKNALNDSAEKWGHIPNQKLFLELIRPYYHFILSKFSDVGWYTDKTTN